jgi:hypothetical protein
MDLANTCSISLKPCDMDAEKLALCDVDKAAENEPDVDVEDTDGDEEKVAALPLGE